MAAMVFGMLSGCAPAQQVSVEPGPVRPGFGTDRDLSQGTALRSRTAGDRLRNQYNETK
jgi:hypothetical protein